ncbi:MULTISPECIES: nuclear transport factor 2 family protein [unclassified Pseudofrankia]|uniref:nuclear transport factor 2 family protein n=1 Tax=unclassified Pseudofrankia TaxID=2994372 RepID=UPI0008DAB13D|nr:MULTISPECIES: nuclear transport factor 2 family protein [unclassified Pseudofrankia]MDT3443438.1 nuclear transport factor 2 family protein [Pseudofrankia sp. BMG5.37]OHV45321.1 hypothetical protein BCD48_23040 [Pseudofrankia sp. BMG5.36]
MELWELAAREQVRDTVATYSHSGDRLRLEDLAACFTADGVLETKGGWTAHGRAEIIARLSGVQALTAATTVPGREAGPRSASGPGPAGNGAASAGGGAADGRAFIRHFVTNLRFESVTPDRITTSAYFAVLTVAGLDHWGRYRDVLVPVEGRWLFAHRLVRTDAHAPGSPFRA